MGIISFECQENSLLALLPSPLCKHFVFECLPSRISLAHLLPSSWVALSPPWCVQLLCVCASHHMFLALLTALCPVCQLVALLLICFVSEDSRRDL